LCRRCIGYAGFTYFIEDVTSVDFLIFLKRKICLCGLFIFVIPLTRKPEIMSGSSKKFYYTVAKVMHWVVGFVIVFNLLSGWKIEDFPLATKQIIIMIHSALGTTIFLMMLFRWWWRKAHNLYAPPKWWKRPSMLLQWVLYPLVLMQAVIGLLQAAFIDYEVLAFGFIPFSSLAAADESLHALFLQLHGLTALLLILLIVCHGIERGRFAFIDDDVQLKAQGPAQS